MLSFFERPIRPKDPKIWPKATVVIPAYNEEKTLAKTIESVLNLDYPRNKLEIIVVDDGSTDSTLKIAKRYISKGVKVIHKKNGGKGSALNLAIKRSTGEFIGGLDADSFVHPKALKYIIAHFDDSKIMAVTPALKIYKPKTFWQFLQHAEYLFGVFNRKAFAVLDAIHVTPGPFTIYRRWFFDKYGGYDENNITEDIEIALRIQRNNYRIENAVNANVYTVSPRTFGELFKQRIRWYLGFIENCVTYRDLFSLKYGLMGIFILPMSFISVGIMIFFSFYQLWSQYRGLSWIGSLPLVNYHASQFIRIPTESFPVVQASFYYLLGVFLLLSGLMLFWANKYSEDTHKLNILSYVVYFFIYFLMFSLWWLGAFAYKLFGRNLHFGGVKWNNSIITKLFNNLPKRI